MNDNNQNSSMNETADQGEMMMEVDGQAEITNVEPIKTLDHSVREGNDASVAIEKVREYYLKATRTADASNAGDTVDTVIIFDTLEAADAANTDETTDTVEQSDFMSICSRVIDDYIESEDFKPILRLTQEQLLIDWLTSRHLLIKDDFDE